MQQITAKVDLNKGSSFTPFDELYRTAFEAREQRAIVAGGLFFNVDKPKYDDSQKRFMVAHEK